MPNKLLQPRLRFKGFSDAWEQRKFKDIVEKLYGGASISPADYQNKGIRTIPKGAVNDSGVADLSGSKFISKDFFNKNFSSHVVTNNLVTSLRDLVPSAPNLGRIVRIEGSDEEFLMPQGVYRLLLFNGINKHFVISYSNSDPYRKIISAEKNGSTQVHLRNGEFLSIDIPLPDSEEQTKIGNFFKQLDDTITLQERKLAKMQDLKQAYLFEMFPQGGETKPRRRFAGFTDEWKARFLFEMTEYKNGISHESMQSNTGKFELINLNSISITGGLKHSGKYINFSPNTLLKNDLVMILSDVGHGDLLGRVALIPENDKFVLNQRVALLRPCNASNAQFLFTYINAHQKYFKYRGAGMSQLNISKKTVETFQDFVPLEKEQQLIGEFFKKMDDTIKLQEAKITKLKALKQAYLKDMFV